MNKKVAIIILIVLAVLMVALFGVLLFVPKFQAPTNNVQNSQAQNTDTEDWKTYKNDEYGFEFEYPAHKGYSISLISGKEACAQNVLRPFWKSLPSILITDGQHSNYQNIFIICQDINSLLSQPICAGNPDTCRVWEETPQETVTIGNRSGYEYAEGITTTNVFTSYTFVSLGKDKTLEIESGGDWHIDKPIIEKIFSTFKFTK